MSKEKLYFLCAMATLRLITNSFPCAVIKLCVYINMGLRRDAPRRLYVLVQYKYKGKLTLLYARRNKAIHFYRRFGCSEYFYIPTCQDLDKIRCCFQFYIQQQFIHSLYLYSLTHVQKYENIHFRSYNFVVHFISITSIHLSSSLCVLFMCAIQLHKQLIIIW